MEPLGMRLSRVGPISNGMRVYLHVSEYVRGGSVEGGDLFRSAVWEFDMGQVALSPGDVLSCRHQVVTRLGRDGVAVFQVTATKKKT